MRKGLVCTAIVLGFVLAPLASQADEVQDQLQRMEDRMAELEDRLQATSDQLNAANDVVERQQEIIDRSGIADQTAGSSGVAAFLDSLEIGGWLAGSYFYNFEDPNGENQAGSNQGVSGFAYPFHGDSNSFQVDQLWFELERPVTESQRAGFRADLCYGKTCDILSDFSSDGTSGSQDDFNLYQAYVQYLAPIGEGITLKFGKFGTLIGAEVAPTVYNFNITRSNNYNLLQPITQVGLLAEMEFGGGFHGALGYVNENVTDNDVDLNNDKSVIGRLGWAGETFSLAANGSYGSTNGRIASLGLSGVPSTAFGPCVPSSTSAPFTICSLESDKETILNLVATWDPTPEFSAYVDATWREVELSQTRLAADSTNGLPAGAYPWGSDVSAWGVAVAGRYAVTEDLGLALRADYVNDEDSFFSGLAFASACRPDPDNGVGGNCALPGKSTELYSLTGTVDYSLTEQLLVRGEVRYDWASVDRVRDNVFFGDRNDSNNRPDKLNDDQVTAGVEVIYNF